MRQWLHGLKSDEALMLAYQRGDVSAFELLYGRHKHGLFGFITRSGPVGQAEEIAQEVWMAIIDQADRYQVSATFKTYLYHIAHNKMVDCWRRQKPLAELDDRAASTDESAEQQYRQHQLRAAIRALPAEQRDALLLRQQGFSQEDIAQITGCGRETVKSRLRYATQTLRQHFEVSV